MFVQQDTDFLSDSYEKSRDCTRLLSELEICKTDQRAKYLKNQILELHTKARKKMRDLKQYINRDDKRFKITRKTYDEKINEYNEIFD